MNSKKFSNQLQVLGAWIQTKKKFLFLSSDYVVIGLSRKDYIKHFPSRDTAHKEYRLIIDEAAKIEDKVWDEFNKRLQDKRVHYLSVEKINYCSLQNYEERKKIRQEYAM